MIFGIDYEVWWFVVITLLFAGYAVLDGFDFGAGAIHLFLRKPESRRVALNAIGPVWDGNEVWLVIGGGALFAGFPEAYASLFSAFYVPFMLFLFMLILRAVSIEFRGKEKMHWWRQTWDVVYAVTSIGLAFSLGVVLGNIIQGIKLDANFVFQGSTWDFFNPLALLTGLASLAACTLHGALYLAMKTEGRIFVRITFLIKRAQQNWLFSFALLSLYIFFFKQEIIAPFYTHWTYLILPVLALIAVLLVPSLSAKRQYGRAFLLSGLSIVLLFSVVAIRLFPVLTPSTLDPAGTLTIYNAAASKQGLSYMLKVVAIGGPLVLAYTAFVFYTFRGKVVLDEHSY